jgi:hypothetical protein
MLLPPISVSAFLSAYGPVDPDLVRRSRAWAILFALMFLAIGRGLRPDYEQIGHATIECVLSEAKLER